MSRGTGVVEPVLRRSGLLRAPTAVAAATASGAPGFVCSGRLPTGKAVGERTPMYAASVTKQLVAALAAWQVAAGHLDPDASVREILPELPGWAAPVRVRHLVHHVAGLPGTADVVTAAGLAGEERLDNARVLDALSRLPAPARPPGVAFDYSNVGYVCLAEIVARIGGVPLDDLAGRRIFGPLGLTGSRLGGPPAARHPGLPPPPGTVGDGGWWTTVADLLRWLRAMNARALGDGVAQIMETPGRLDDGTPLSYAWGVTVSTRAGGRTFTHGGNWPGWSAKTVRQPGRGTAVAVLSCSGDVDRVSGTALALADRLSAPEDGY